MFYEVDFINLSMFQLPGVSTVQFTFIDPVYVWLQQCQKLIDNGTELKWFPCRRVTPRGKEDKEIYGAGIEDGLLFRAAHKSVPAGGFPALMHTMTNFKISESQIDEALDDVYPSGPGYAS